MGNKKSNNKALQELMASKTQLKNYVSESDPLENPAELASESVSMQSAEPAPSAEPSNDSRAEAVAAPAPSPVPAPSAESAESAKCNVPPEQGQAESGGSTPLPTAIPVNIDIEKSLGNAIYNQLINVQKTLSDFKLDVSKEPLKTIVERAIKDATIDYHNKVAELREQEEEQRRKEGKPANNYELYKKTYDRHIALTNTYNDNIKVSNERYKFIVERLGELLHKINLDPVAKPKMPTTWEELRSAIFAIPWYYIRRVFYSWHVRWVLKVLMWTVFCICPCLLIAVTMHSIEQRKVVEKYRMVKAFYATDKEVSETFMLVDGLWSDPDINAAKIDSMIVLINKKNSQYQNDNK